MRFARTIGFISFALIAIGGAEAEIASPIPKAVSENDYVPINRAEAEFGRLLFWDPILSGNKNISCGTCHHPRFGTSDGVSLSLGEGGIGLGPERRADPENHPEQRIPRNSPALFNLGAKEFTVLFHDGRIEVDPSRPSGLRTPLGDDMVAGFSNILSAQNMFPVLSQDEMAGHYGENDISKAVRQGLITGEGGAWDIIAKRVAALSAYADGFAALDPEIGTSRDLTFADISNVIAAFVAFEWRSDESPFDRHLRGETPLSTEALAGKELFYGRAGCGTCHTGAFQTDHSFHVAGVPQFGPGKAARFESHNRDEGRFRVTGRADDLYRFRTPSLRNVAHTAPYGHSGSHRDLRDFIAFHADPGDALLTYAPDPGTAPVFYASGDAQIGIGDDFTAIQAKIEMPDVDLNSDDLDALMAFMSALTDQQAIDGRLGIPDEVPSGLPVDR
ncbi:MAG: cytochrome c peroxidase [Pseudomonadota bacterium]